MKLSKLFSDKISGDPLDWPEGSGQIVATIDHLLADDGMKMNYLKTFVIGRAEVATEGTSYNAGTYKNARDILAREFGWPNVAVNAQFKKLHSYPFIETHDTAEVIK